MWYFSSDHHFFHVNIIKYCNRPFPDLKTMHRELIKRHNSIVTNEDRTYFIGDFAMLRKDKISKIQPILKQMNGEKHLILGNHDEGKVWTYIKMGFKSVHTSLELEDFLLIHDPKYCNIEQKGIVGHTHRISPEKHLFNVGVDNNKFYPFSFNEIKEYFKNV